MSQMSEYIKTQLPAIAGKLECEGMTRETYGKEKARAILSECVAGHRLSLSVDMFESEIIERLP